MITSLAEKNPLAVFLYFLAAAGIVMFSMNPVMIAISLIGALLFLFVSGRKTALLGWLFLLFLASTILNPLFYHNGKTVLFVLNDNPITLEATLYGMVSGAMLVAVMLWFIHFSSMMTTDKLLYLFGSLSPKLSLMLSMTLRYVPLFAAQVKKTNDAQKGMGLYKEDNIIDRCRGGIRIFSVMVTWALENGIVTADSMTARGYGTKRRTFFSLFRFRAADGIFLGVVAILTGLVAIGTVAGATAVEYYPTVQIANKTIWTYLSYAAYALLSLMPTLLELGVKIKWKYLQSKI